MEQEFDFGTKLVCTMRLTGWDPQPYFGQPVTVVGFAKEFGDYAITFDDPEGHPSRTGEHLVHRTCLMDPAEFELVQATKGLG